ncbi:MAG: hypothetical protein ACRCU1_03425 [Alsobacter sp.]
MSWQDPIEALMLETEASLAVDADDVGGRVASHAFGLKHTKEHGAPPKYVWVPTRAREDKTPVSRTVTEVPQIASFHRHFEVHCWGASHAQKWAMVQNAWRAISHLCGADIRFENGRELHPSEAWNQAGEVFILEMSLKVPIIDAYVGLTDLDDPESEAVQPIAGEAVTSLTDDLEVDGEAGPPIDVDEDDLDP